MDHKFHHKSINLVSDCIATAGIEQYVGNKLRLAKISKLNINGF